MDQLHHLLAKGLQIEAAVAGDAGHRAQALFQPFDRGTLLPALRVEHSHTDLKKEPHELQLVADRLKEKLFEPVAGIVEVPRLKVGDGHLETRIVFNRSGVMAGIHRVTGETPGTSQDVRRLTVPLV